MPILPTLGKYPDDNPSLQEVERTLRDENCSPVVGWWSAFWIKITALFDDAAVANKIFNNLTQAGGQGIHAATLRWFTPKQLETVRGQLEKVQDARQRKQIRAVFQHAVHWAYNRGHSEEKQHALIGMYKSLEPTSTKSKGSPVPPVIERFIVSEPDRTERYFQEYQDCIENAIRDPNFQKDPFSFIQKMIDDRGLTDDFRGGEDYALMYFKREYLGWGKDRLDIENFGEARVAALHKKWSKRIKGS